ncbi:MAG: hypothetical protein P0Y53_08295 [Candidatus Pseudobacter hemicellulosilyticus]|uniref:Uncharacterized protein n=1 Tax=Candidatus Pseudobacter hemicellulosilyticus TaxID=3121375 RepID=A0AAJ5WZU8_9BACT|nr:MAG: hypothetical protein P0Y53_08295 [Pseudobacter sp.]
MKRVTLLLLAIGVCLSCLSQKPSITWGDEFKLKKGSLDLEVIHTDETGVYLQEGHMTMKGFYVIMATMRTSASLVKLDKNLSEVYRNDFNKDLRGKEFVQFFACQEKLLLFASEYSKAERTMIIYAAEVNKADGELAGMWKQVCSFQKEEKKDEINFKIIPNADSTRFVVVSSVEGKERNEYQVQEFDKTIKAGGKPVVISNEFEPKKYQLEDLLYTMDKKIILVGRNLDYEEGKKKKAKFLNFQHYNIRIYDAQGKQETEINTNINGKWLSSTKLVLEKNRDLILAAFFSNEKKGKTIDGLLVQRIDPVNGKVISTSEKQINNSMLSADMNAASETDDDDDKESKTERKERERLEKLRDEAEGFSKFMRFRQIYTTVDNGVVIMAEAFRHYYYTRSTLTGTGINGMTTYRDETVSVYESGDLMMVSIDAAGNIGWLQVVPKQQREEIVVGYLGGSGVSFGYNYAGFFENTNRPFYSGFGVIQDKGILHVLLNDNPKNAAVTQAGQKVKYATRLGRSHCFVLSVDEKTGKFTRKFFFDNRDVPTAMPRLGSVIGENMYMVGKTDRTMGKSKIAVAKIAIK